MIASVDSIYLFQRNHIDSTLKKANGGNTESFFAAIIKRYGELIAIPKDKDGNHIELTPEQCKERKEELKRFSEEIRKCVLEDILVRRTRTDIIKYYGGKLKFPTISGPHGLEYKMENGLAELFAKTMNLIAPSVDFQFNNSDFLCYYRYRAIEFLLDADIKNVYRNI